MQAQVDYIEFEGQSEGGSQDSWRLTGPNNAVYCGSQYGDGRFTLVNYQIVDKVTVDGETVYKKSSQGSCESYIQANGG